jgi:hypothetical protein
LEGGVYFVCKKKASNLRGNQNPYIEEQTTQWPKEKVQNSIYFSINCFHK